MDLLPQELWTLLLSFMADKTKRQMRLANTEWFNLIKYNKFNLYFTQPEDVPAIAERLSKYSWPIKLKFEKSKLTNPLELIDHLPKLTNLIKLRADVLDIQGDVSHDQWMRLSVLTNLQIWSPMPDATPMELWKTLSNLTLWSLSVPEEAIAPVLPHLPKLELFYYFQSEVKTWPFALLSYPERLTALNMSPGEKIEHGQEMWSRLINLRNLGYYDYEPSNDNKLELQYLTALKGMNMYGGSLPSFAANTNLVWLKLDYKEWPQSSSDSLAALKKLEELEIIFQEWPENTVQFEFLSQLTALQILNLSDDNRVPRVDEVLSYLYPRIPPSVKEMRLAVNCDLEQLTHLTNIEALRMLRDTKNVKYLEGFTTLTQLHIYHRDEDDYGPVTRLTQLQDLLVVGTEYNHPGMEEKSFIDLQNFVHLTRLFCKSRHYPSSKLAQLKSLTNLEYLSIDGDTDEPIEHCDFLAGLTNLTYLRIEIEVDNVDALWKNLPDMTRLQELTIPIMHDDYELLGLSPLSQLTSLNIQRIGQSFAGVYFTKFTSLQSLMCDTGGDTLAYTFEDLKKALPYLQRFNQDY